MAIDINKIPVGAAVVSIGDWVTAAGAGSLVDVGATQGGVELSAALENLLIGTDQTAGAHRSVPHTQGYQLKVPIAEAAIANDRRFYRQPTGNLTGVAPNSTLAIDAAQEQYLQCSIVTKGIASTAGIFAARTYTLWKLSIAAIDSISFKKDGVQMRNVTFDVLEDPSVTAGGGSGRFLKVADAGGS